MAQTIPISERRPFSKAFQLSDGALTIVSKNNVGHDYKRIVEQEGGGKNEDSAALSLFKKAEIILPPYSKKFIFFANYENGMAVVKAEKDEDGQYYYDFVTKNIQWGDRAFEAVLNPDIFMIIVVVITLLVTYLIGYIFIHSYTKPLSVDQSNQLFDRLPSLKKRCSD